MEFDATHIAGAIYDTDSSAVVLGHDLRLFQEETIAEKFGRLAAKWESDALNSSSIDDIIDHDAYQKIIEMGQAVVPLILADLMHAPKHWFYALRMITGADPIPAKYAGNLQKMTEAWIKWGRKQGYV